MVVKGCVQKTETAISQRQRVTVFLLKQNYNGK